MIRLPRLLLCALLAASSAAAYTYRPVSVSFVPPLSTNGFESGDVETRFSFNIIGGYIGRVDGFELGSVFNIVRGDFRGGEIAGALNLVAGEFSGLQLAPVNITAGGHKTTYVGSRRSQRRGRLNGMQLGAVNIAGAEVLGVQLGATNLALYPVSGIQLGAANIGADYVTAQVGSFNLAAGNTELQLGAANITAGMPAASRGMSFTPGASSRVQVGAFNLATGRAAAQLGTVNICDRVGWAQVGVVNIADESDVSIGIVNIVRHGQFRVTAGASDFAALSAGLKTGSKYVHSVFGMGLRPSADGNRLISSLGLGGHIPRNGWFIDVDAVANSLSAPGDIFDFSGLRLVAQARALAGLPVAAGIAVVAGPSVNIFVSDREDGSTVPYYNAAFWSGRSGSTWLRIWPGFALGLHLL